MVFSKRLIQFGFVFLFLFTQLATASSDPAHTFSFRLVGEPETLDWNRAHTPTETHLLMNLMEGLVQFDSELKVIPALAKSWTKSRDGKTYTFKLRNDVKWSDGVPLKAADFVYSWRRLLMASTAASYSYFLFDIQNAKEFNEGKLKDFSNVGVKALDDLTLQVKLTRPIAHWICIPTFWVTFPLRQDVVEKQGPGWETPGRMVTLGPFTLASHDFDTKVVLKANPLYYGKRGNVEQINALVIQDDATALNLYEAGKLDLLVDISTVDLKRLEKRPDLHVFPYLKTGFLGFVEDKYPLSNVKVRRAIAMAIDRSKIPDILHGGQVPATSLIPPKMKGYSKSLGLPFNVEKAQEELRTSGYDRVRQMKIEMLLPNRDKLLTLAEFIQNELKKNLGIQVTLQALDNKTYRSQLDLQIYPLFEGSWSADYPDPDNFMSVFLSDSGNNRTHWSSPTYDQWVLQARGSMDQGKREKLYSAAQKMLLDEAVIVPIYYEPNTALVRPRVHHLELDPLNNLSVRKVTLGP